VGKTWLACVLGQQACRDNATVIYKRATRLFSELELAHGDGSYPRLFRNLTKADLLIIDDWRPDRLTASQRRDLMEIVEDRYGTGATLITSQLPVDAWHEIIGDPTFADAILDRVRRSPPGLNRWRHDGQLLEPMAHQWLTSQRLSHQPRRPINAQNSTENR
jgi:DNA replication protein DnaC